MTEWQIVDEESVGYYSGYAYLISNGECKFYVWERKEDAEKVCDMLNTQYTINKEAILKRIIKCYLTFEKEATSNTILKHIEDTGYGLRGLTGSSYLTKRIKKWKHDHKYLNHMKWYVNDKGATVFYLDEK